MKTMLARTCLIVVLGGGVTSFAADTPTFERRDFPLPESIWSVESADCNGDGRLDLLAMGHMHVYVLEAPEFKPREIFDAGEPKMLYSVALDIDGDGDLDLAVGRYRAPWIEYREAKKAGKNPEEPKGPDFSVGWLENPGRGQAPWKLHIIDRELNGIHGLWTGDVDGDGLKDLIADSIIGPAFPNSVLWFKRVMPGLEFQRHPVALNSADGRPHYLDFADLNQDKRGDILLGDSQVGYFTWWEQSDAVRDKWIKHTIGKEKGATNIRAADLNGDGKLDVAASCGHGKGVFWFEGGDWNKHVIDADINSPHALGCADFDGDGDIDVVIASFTDYTVRWYENDGRGNFKPHDIDTGHKQQAYDLKVVDLDRDGHMDFILAGRESNNAVWYRNAKP